MLQNAKTDESFWINLIYTVCSAYLLCCVMQLYVQWLLVKFPLFTCTNSQKPQKKKKEKTKKKQF